MIRVRSFAARRRMAGLSLIELMVALVLGLFVAAGIISVFASTSSSNKAQQQMATLQEEGRFAIHSLRTDLANANGGYCSNSGGNATAAAGSGLFLDGLRTPTVYSTVALSFPDNTLAALPAPTQAYSLPSSVFMRGYDCTVSACTPVDPSTATPAGIPAMGTAINQRVVGTDVLTIRYLQPDAGWAITPSTEPGTHMAIAGNTATITLAPLTGEPPASDFTGSLAMLADCSNAQVFAANVGGGTVTIQGGSGQPNYAVPLDITQGAAPRIFDFNNSFQTITYYVRVVDAGNGRTTGELVRRLNGVDQPLVRGVERLDFLYGVIGADGDTRYLTATQVDNLDGGAMTCPPDVSTPGGMPATGCLWRAVQTVEVHVLMDGQTPLYTLTPAELNYVYTPDGAMTPTAPASHAIQPKANQGFPEHLLRREFTTLVALRNFNP